MPRDQRKGNRRALQETPFQGGRDSPGIQHVIPKVGPQVDARDHHVRFILQKAIEPQMHTIGRRAVDTYIAVAESMRMQRTVERQRAAGAAFVLIRCDNHALGMIGQRSMQRGDTGCGYPIIVRNQNTHGLSVCPTGTRSTSSRTNAVAKHPAGRTNSNCRMSGTG